MHTDQDVRMLNNSRGCLHKGHVAAGLVRWCAHAPRGHDGSCLGITSRAAHAADHPASTYAPATFTCRKLLLLRQLVPAGMHTLPSVSADGARCMLSQ
jgi:hypothetical protein